MFPTIVERRVKRGEQCASPRQGVMSVLGGSRSSCVADEPESGRLGARLCVLDIHRLAT
jgi:hypothetical protein